MEKILWRVNLALSALGILMLASGIMLETLHGQSLWFPFDVCAWLHAAVSLVFFILAVCHIHLHWGKVSRWLSGFRNTRRKPVKVLFVLSLLTFATGIAAVVAHVVHGHTTLGGVHGKIGFVMALLALFHVVRRRRWFRKRPKGDAFVPQIDDAKCVRCAQCVKRCPAQVFEKQDGRIAVTRPAYCQQCRKCVDHCPRHAIG